MTEANRLLLSLLVAVLFVCQAHLLYAADRTTCLGTPNIPENLPRPAKMPRDGVVEVFTILNLVNKGLWDKETAVKNVAAKLKTLPKEAMLKLENMVKTALANVAGEAIGDVLQESLLDILPIVGAIKDVAATAAAAKKSAEKVERMLHIKRHLDCVRAQPEDLPIRQLLANYHSRAVRDSVKEGVSTGVNTAKAVLNCFGFGIISAAASVIAKAADHVVDAISDSDEAGMAIAQALDANKPIHKDTVAKMSKMLEDKDEYATAALQLLQTCHSKDHAKGAAKVTNPDGFQLNYCNDYWMYQARKYAGYIEFLNHVSPRAKTDMDFFEGLPLKKVLKLLLEASKTAVPMDELTCDLTSYRLQKAELKKYRDEAYALTAGAA